ncbi:hypothetical protein C8Q70DRAFT_1057302 [Cubamyces menziesii]|nr:hypothetical protein C8Q70DRAFT_1057302 [Cubamyces menziesii]
MSVTALLLYDWVITLNREKALVWSRKINLAGVLYVLGRLVGPSSNLASLVLFNNVSDKVSIVSSDGRAPISTSPFLYRCQNVIYAQYVLNLLPYAFWGVFSAFRTHALSGRNRVLSAFVFLLNLVPIALNSASFTYVYFFSQAVNYFPPIGCSQNYNGPNTSTAFFLIESAISSCSRGSIILAECIVIALTWKSVGLFRRGKHNRCGLAGITASSGGSNIRDVLVVYGTLCFGVSIVLNILTLALLQVGENADQVIELLAYFRDALASIMASRFLLELLKVTKVDEDSKYRTSRGAIFSTMTLSGDNSAGDDDDWAPSIAYLSPSNSVDDIAEARSLTGEDVHIA